MDEMTTTGTTAVAILDEGHVFTHDVVPEDAGLPRARLADLRGGSAAENADALRRLLQGERSPYRDIVLLNAAAALVIAEKAENLAAGVTLAGEAIDSGGAMRALEKLIMSSNA
jgi:anthranilate phosphoribosyltransferase